MASEHVRPALQRRAFLTALCTLGAGGTVPRLARASEHRVTCSDVTLIDGGVLRAETLRAQPVVVEVWATWCPFCMKQNPHVQRLHETAGGKGLLVLTFAIDDDVGLIEAYRRRYGYTFAMARITPQVERWFGRRRFLPEIYVVDKSGHVVLREEGEMFPEDIAALARFAAGA